MWIIGLIGGGLAGTIVGILYNHWKNKKELLFIINSRMVLERNRPQIEVRYEGEPIERLYSHEVVVRNKGYRDLKDISVKIMCDSGKFVEPIEIMNRPLGTRIEKSLQEDGKMIVMRCDLLKREEEFTVGLAAVDSLNEKIVVVSRTEDVSETPITRDDYVKKLEDTKGRQFFHVVPRIFVLLMIPAVVVFVSRLWSDLSHFIRNAPELSSLEQYTILIDNFTYQTQAESLATELRAAQVNSFFLQQGSKWFVCVGRFQSFTQADSMKQALRDRGFEDAIVLAPKKKSPEPFP